MEIPAWKRIVIWVLLIFGYGSLVNAGLKILLLWRGLGPADWGAAIVGNVIAGGLMLALGMALKALWRGERSN